AKLAAEQAARLRYELQLRLVAVALLDEGAHIAEPVDKTKLQPLLRGPEHAGEKFGIVRELRAAPFLHHVDEGFVDFELQFLEALDVLLLLRPEGIEDRLVLAGRVDTSLDTDLLVKILETDACGHHADGTDDGG